MHTIKKNCVLVSIFLLSISPLFAQAASAPGRYALSLNPLFGVLYGQSEEIVYKYTGRDQYLSELLWDLKPLVFLGLAADFGPKDPFQRNGFVATGSLKFGLPLKSGALEDRDWNNWQYDYLTHFSRHDAYTGFTMLADIRGGYSWRLTDYLALSALGEFSYMRFSWTGKDGYSQYPPDDSSKNFPPWNSNLPKTPFSGIGIKYLQNWYTFSPGFSLKGRLSHQFFVEGNFSYTPLIYCVDKDEHLVRHLTFWDICYFGHYIQGGGGLTFTPVHDVDLSLTVAYRYITGTRGISYMQKGNDPVAQTPTDGAGVGYKTLDITLAAKIRVWGREH